ncbi:hypothetical protein Bca52824_082240 [Brassica carinata]|uniref:Uncharacterized protein n=1 Tax=Brassica carinata TaxID=52824 RepID=A0A8X7TSD6_BRACI|nr:hypothetical protein Bca52824_082240 [Brassica carinata]
MEAHNVKNLSDPWLRRHQNQRLTEPSVVFFHVVPHGLGKAKIISKLILLWELLRIFVEMLFNNKHHYKFVNRTTKVEPTPEDTKVDKEEEEPQKENKGVPIFLLTAMKNNDINSKESQPFEKVIKWMERMKETEDKQKKRIVFVSSFVLGFKKGFMLIFFYTPAMMDLRSMHIERCWLQNLFKNILDSDKYKTAPEYAITLQELNSEELQLEKHVYALFVAADKYMIHYLQEFCEKHMLSSLKTSIVFLTKRLKEAAIGFVVQNMDDIIVLDKYEAFSQKNQHLCVQISRAFLTETRSKRRD